jgi:hypothetical protein
MEYVMAYLTALEFASLLNENMLHRFVKNIIVRKLIPPPNAYLILNFT